VHLLNTFLPQISFGVIILCDSYCTLAGCLENQLAFNNYTLAYLSTRLLYGREIWGASVTESKYRIYIGLVKLSLSSFNEYVWTVQCVYCH